MGKIKEIKSSLIYFIKVNAIFIYSMLLFANPYIMFFVKKEDWVVALLLPIIIFSIAIFFKGIAEKSNNGNEFPTYKKRFTKQNGKNGIDFDLNDLSEMIVYLNEVENFLERKGKLR